MGTQQVSAPSRVPSFGVVHVNIRLTDGYTIISNRLSQHRGLSLLAIGLGTHIQSLPDGWRVGIKALAAVFPESEARIADALRELEQHGFLRRTRERGRGGRLITRTVFHNHPDAAARGVVKTVPVPVGEARATPVPTPEPAPVPATEPAPVPEPVPVPVGEPAPVPEPVPVPVGEPAPVPEPVPVLVTEPAPAPVPVPVTEPAPVLVTDLAPVPTPVPESVTVREEPTAVRSDPAPAPRLVPVPTAPRQQRAPLPGPDRPTEALSAAAADLLAGLRRTAPLFVLSEEDVRRLAPGVAAWLERGVRPDAVREALTDDPPVPLRHPAKLLRHRLTVLLPPPLPVAAPVVPLQNCEDCDRAFRSSVPGVCRGCGEGRAGGAGPFRLSA
ncbi:hypothetical protein ACIOD0_17120 [Kitasatospora albolonga]